MLGLVKWQRAEGRKQQYPLPSGALSRDRPPGNPERIRSGAWFAGSVARRASQAQPRQPDRTCTGPCIARTPQAFAEFMPNRKFTFSNPGLVPSILARASESGHV